MVDGGINQHNETVRSVQEAFFSVWRSKCIADLCTAPRKLQNKVMKPEQYTAEQCTAEQCTSEQCTAEQCTAEQYTAE